MAAEVDDNTISANVVEVSTMAHQCTFVDPIEANAHFEKDDDEEGEGGGRYQRSRQEPPPGSRLKRGLLEIAEDHGRLPHEVAANLARLAADNYSDEYVKNTFLAVILKLVVEQPFKIPFVAAVVLYANTEKPEMAQDIVARAAEQTQAALHAGSWREFKLLLRFLSCLTRLYETDGITPILDELFSRAADLQTASSEDVSFSPLPDLRLLCTDFFDRNSLLVLSSSKSYSSPSRIC
jgi:nuclear cap-binding protein subunit 1